jgi:hypothetical protein
MGTLPKYPVKPWGQHTVARGTFNVKQEATFAYDSEAKQICEDDPLTYQADLTYESIVTTAPSKRVNGQSYDRVNWQPRPSSGFYGVYADEKLWKAMIHCGRQNSPTYLGRFDTKQEAALAYDRQARAIGGEETPLNFINAIEAEDAATQAQAEHTLINEMCAGLAQAKPSPPKFCESVAEQILAEAGAGPWSWPWSVYKVLTHEGYVGGKNADSRKVQMARII